MREEMSGKDPLEPSNLLKDMFLDAKKKFIENQETLKSGIRVVRGPDWTDNDTDGGEGFVGTVCEIGKVDPQKKERAQQVNVIWDIGTIKKYEIGASKKFPLCLLDSAPSGVIHKKIKCGSCDMIPIIGVRWKCTICFNYNLCSKCYHNDNHDTQHEFWRYINPTNKRFKVPVRHGGKKIQSKGIFQNAKVVRGFDWKWGDQDGGNISVGHVLLTLAWNAKKTADSAARVRWSEKNNENNYRVGYEGKVDLQCVAPGNGYLYYKDHLSILGKEEVSPCELQVGDLVRCCYDADLVKLLQKNHGGWVDAMTEYVYLNGKVHAIDEDNDVVVLFDDDKKWCFNQDALRKVNDQFSVTSHPMNSVIVKNVMELGFKKELVKSITWKRFSEGKGYFDSEEELVEMILQNQKVGSVIQQFGNIVLSENQRDDNVPVAAARQEADAEKNNDENQRYAEENMLLKKKLECKVCFNDQASVTIVPCGHYCMCDNCSEKIKDFCPLCRGPIEKLIRTFQ
uniref:RING-type E3 ubiquitin transferase n=1 Tax=Biomphalaria glabrata TaxID=6526 RepID=A0A2C9JT16_BIOGL